MLQSLEELDARTDKLSAKLDGILSDALKTITDLKTDALNEWTAALQCPKGQKVVTRPIVLAEFMRSVPPQTVAAVSYCSTNWLNHGWHGNDNAAKDSPIFRQDSEFIKALRMSYHPYHQRPDLRKQSEFIKHSEQIVQIVDTFAKKGYFVKRANPHITLPNPYSPITVDGGGIWTDAEEYDHYSDGKF